ncbi:type III pantothenate kinase [Fontimonas sp. SYSU GA230001]|uniref:type III pantothenate kinase n=1 Tax=Fontimonas sp. SYSU GA230001 TaxID=3142450 RepID=UPI0032B62981
MNLLLDIGNSRLKWALASGDGLLHTGAALHHGDPAATVVELPPDVPDGIWVAHVTGAAHEAALAQALRQRYGLDPQFARSTAQWRGLRSAYDEPQRLGVDRWLVMIAAWAEQPSAFCVVDAGTALTIDGVDGRGQHLGGVICAGLHTQQRATLGHTRFETRASPAHYQARFGRNTEACVREGAFLACLGAIERGAVAAGAPARRLITGGDAGLLCPHLPTDWEHRPHLVLEGLLAYARGA